MKCGSDARIVADKMRHLMPNSEIFLDSDDLFDLRALLEDVKNSQALVLFQSAGVLSRPWCLLEIVTAIKHEVPHRVPQRGRADIYATSAAFMTHLDTELERVNPGAGKIMEKQGVDVLHAAYLLSNHIPNCISVDFNPHGSSNAINASLMDLVEAMSRATPRAIDVTEEEWLAKRGPPPPPIGVYLRGTLRATKY